MNIKKIININTILVLIVCVAIIFPMFIILNKDKGLLDELDELYSQQKCQELQGLVNDYKNDENAQMVYDYSYKCAFLENDWANVKKSATQLIVLDQTNKKQYQEAIERAGKEIDIQRIEEENLMDYQPSKGSDSANELY